MSDYLATLDRLIAKHPGGCGEGLRMARDEYEDRHDVREIHNCGECPCCSYDHDGDPECNAAGRRTLISETSPADWCPLRGDNLVVRLKGGG